MPPRATGRGRGARGRGRGGQGRGESSAAPASGDTSDTTALAAEPSNTSEPAAAGVAPHPAPTNDAPAPTAPPESNTTPRASASQATASARPTGSAKFKPKATRRSEAERARIAEEQERLQAQRYAEESRLQPTPRGCGQVRGRGRGRGGLLRGSGRQMTSGGMSFGSMTGSGSSSTSGYGQATEYEGGGSGDADGEQKLINDGRINADALYGFVPHDDQEDQTTSAFARGARKRKAMMPMGIRRVEHKEEAVTMATAAEIEAQDRGEEPDGGNSDSELFVGSGGTPKGEPAADNSVWEHAVPKTRTQVQIKQEPVDGDAMDLDMPEGKLKTPDSPELTKKDLTGADEKKKKKAVVKDLEEEWAAKKLERMLDLFTLREEGSHANDLEGHMFLFQFPSVLPTLKPVSADGAATVVKPEPEGDDELFVSNDPPKTTTSIDLTGIPDTKVKEEGDEEDKEAEAEHEDELKEAGFVGNLIVRKSGKAELSWGGQSLVVEPGIQTNFFSQAVLIDEGDVKPGQTADYAGAAYGMGRIQGKFTLAPVWQDEEEWVIPEESLEWGKE